VSWGCRVTSNTSHVTCHTSHATHHASHVTRHTSHVTRHTLHVTRHTPHATRYTSHGTRHTTPEVLLPSGRKAPYKDCSKYQYVRTPHTSHVTRHTSHATRHTSHVTRHTSHVTRHTPHVTRHTSHSRMVIRDGGRPPIRHVLFDRLPHARQHRLFPGGDGLTVPERCEVWGVRCEV
jgi:hypothetical protein